MDVRPGTSLAAVVAVAVVIAVAVPHGTRHPPHPAAASQQSRVMARAVAVAERLARADADQPPALASELRTTANQAGLPGLRPDLPIAIVELSGAFTGYDAVVPAGTPLPTGSYFHVVLDAASGRLLAWGIADAPLVGRPVSTGRLSGLLVG